MKQMWIIVFTISLLLSACSAEKGIEVHSAWMRPAVQGENGAVYFVLHNHSSSADELVEATSDAAEAVEIHESTATSEDIIQMNRLSSVPLEPFAEIEFAPGGLHMMLVRLKQNFGVNDDVAVVLHFRNSEDITVVAHVEDIAPENDHHHE
jgi:periplasmic copper chaperone A